jgi:hypothetical protein
MSTLEMRPCVGPCVTAMILPRCTEYTADNCRVGTKVLPFVNIILWPSSSTELQYTTGCHLLRLRIPTLEMRPCVGPCVTAMILPRCTEYTADNCRVILNIGTKVLPFVNIILWPSSSTELQYTTGCYLLRLRIL